MPEDTKHQEVKFRFFVKPRRLHGPTRIKQFVYPASNNLLPSVSLADFLADVSVLHSQPDMVPDELLIKGSDQMWGRIRKDQPDKFCEFWEYVQRERSMALEVCLFWDVGGERRPAGELEIWTEEMRRKGVTRKEMDKFYPGLVMPSEEEEEAQEEEVDARSELPIQTNLDGVGIKFVVVNCSPSKGLVFEFEFLAKYLDQIDWPIWKKAVARRIEQMIKDDCKVDGFIYRNREGQAYVLSDKQFDNLWTELKLDAATRDKKALAHEALPGSPPYQPEPPTIEIALSYNGRTQGLYDGLPKKAYTLQDSLSQEAFRYRKKEVSSQLNRVVDENTGTTIARLLQIKRDEFFPASDASPPQESISPLLSVKGLTRHYPDLALVALSPTFFPPPQTSVPYPAIEFDVHFLGESKIVKFASEKLLDLTLSDWLRKVIAEVRPWYLPQSFNYNDHGMGYAKTVDSEEAFHEICSILVLDASLRRNQVFSDVRQFGRASMPNNPRIDVTLNWEDPNRGIFEDPEYEGCWYESTPQKYNFTRSLTKANIRVDQEVIEQLLRCVFASSDHIEKILDIHAFDSSDDEDSTDEGEDLKQPSLGFDSDEAESSDEEEVEDLDSIERLKREHPDHVLPIANPPPLYADLASIRPPSYAPPTSPGYARDAQVTATRQRTSNIPNMRQAQRNHRLERLREGGWPSNSPYNRLTPATSVDFEIAYFDKTEQLDWCDLPTLISFKLWLGNVAELLHLASPPIGFVYWIESEEGDKEMRVSNEEEFRALWAVRCSVSTPPRFRSALIPSRDPRPLAIRLVFESASLLNPSTPSPIISSPSSNPPIPTSSPDIVEKPSSARVKTLNSCQRISSDSREDRPPSYHRAHSSKEPTTSAQTQLASKEAKRSERLESYVNAGGRTDRYLSSLIPVDFEITCFDETKQITWSQRATRGPISFDLWLSEVADLFDLRFEPSKFTYGIRPCIRQGKLYTQETVTDKEDFRKVWQNRCDLVQKSRIPGNSHSTATPFPLAIKLICSEKSLRYRSASPPKGPVQFRTPESTYAVADSSTAGAVAARVERWLETAVDVDPGLVKGLNSMGFDKHCHDMVTDDVRLDAEEAEQQASQSKSEVSVPAASEGNVEDDSKQLIPRSHSTTVVTTADQIPPPPAVAVTPTTLSTSTTTTTPSSLPPNLPTPSVPGQWTVQRTETWTFTPIDSTAPSGPPPSSLPASKGQRPLRLAPHARSSSLSYAQGSLEKRYSYGQKPVEYTVEEQEE